MATSSAVTPQLYLGQSGRENKVAKGLGGGFEFWFGVLNFFNAVAIGPLFSIQI